jgi:anti-sigma B factor antagonist
MTAWERRERKAALDVRAKRFGPAVVLDLQGPLTAESDVQLLERVIGLVAREHPACVVLNLERVRALDCAGIGLLLRVRSRLGRRGGAVALANVERRQKHLLRLAGLCAAFPMLDNWRMPEAPFDYSAALPSHTIARAS